ncbi:hypothetical protein HAZT_HAZT011606 [Hyalella azteca]|uniref:TOG domain-containing protein n=1 Tax=Hyalella azteca TaxID=294128 RepID=A0A6A0HIH9_HYAAZ|nr:hypothetical protein HAZT_HAZT011606 [Hyalella azteca]
MNIGLQDTYDTVSSDTKLQLLLGALFEESLGEELRSMAAVLLRRFLSSSFDEVFPKLPPHAQTSIRGQLLAGVLQEGNPQLRKKMCDVISELAHALLDEEGNNLWPEFLHFLFESANSNQVHHKEVALTLFSLVPGTFGNQQAQHLGMIRTMLLSSLNDTANPTVQALAVKATSSFLLLHDSEATIHKGFADLLPPMLNIIAASIEQGDDDALLKSLVDVAETCPKYLRPQLEPILQLTVKVLPDDNIPEAFRHLLLEVVVTLAETAPGMVRKVSGKYLAQLIPHVLNMMTDLEDEEDWSVSDELLEEDNDSSSVVAESSLDRLACGLGGKTVLPHINSALSQMLNSQDWKHRHAALMAISAVGEGCHKQMEAMLPQIMDAIIVFLRDSHPRVRFAACNAIGQMATDFAPTFQKKFHEMVVPGLLAVMEDAANPRVQAHAGAALVNFSEVCPKNILTTYLPTIIGQLERILEAKFTELMEKGTKLVLEQVVTTIASVADTAEENFLQYYDKFMPCLMYIIENANSQELRMLRGKTIECVSLIGLAVGPDKFMTDAGKMMDLLLKAQTNQDEMSDDDPQVSYLISAWARVCKIMGKRFEPYLPLVMGPVLKTASLKPEVALLDNEDMNTVDNEDDWQFVSIGEQQNFGIRTAGLEEKATACQMLVCYARELKDAFADYTEEVVKLMVPMLKFYFHDGVRTAAAESLPYLLECARIKGALYLQEMWSFICPELLKAIETEPENEVLSEHMYSMAKCIEVLGSGCLSEEQTTELVKMLDKVLTNHFERANKRHEKRKDEDYDEVVEEQLLDEDDEDTYALSKVSDVLHSLFAAYGSQFFPFFDAILPHIVHLLSPERSWPDHQWGLCIFDDVIEYGGPNCIKYTDHFLQDADEAPHVYGYLCDLIDANHPLVLGPNNANLPNIAFIKEAIERSSEVGERMVLVLQQLQASPDVFSVVLQHLSQQQQHAIHIFLNPQDSTAS